MGASVRPEPQNPADLWEQLVASGMNKADATAEVQRRVQQPSVLAPRDVPQAGGLTELITGKQTPPEITQARELARSEGTGGRLMNALSGGAQGRFLGFADEAMAGIAALATGHPIRNYRRNLEYIREHQRMAREESPGLTLASEFIGGASIPGGAALSAGKAGLRTAATRGALVGAGAGGVAGAGYSEGDLQDRASGAVRGAAAGGLIGTIVPPVAAGAGKAGSVVADITGVRRLIDRLPRRVPTPIESNAQRADRLLLQALRRDEVPIGEVEANLLPSGLTPANKPLNVMDVAGENVRGLGRAAQSIPSKAKNQIAEALERRAEGQPSRVAGDLEAALGAREDVFQKADDLIAARRQAAQPLYEKAYAAPPVESKALSDLMDIPEFRDAYNRGRRIARVEDVSLPELPKDGPVGALPVQGLDYMKRGLDAMIESRAGSESALSRTEARALRGRLEKVLEEVDNAVPEYAEARRQFAGDSRLIEALEDGRNFLQEDARLTTKAINEMSEGERELFRTGAIDAIRKAMDETADTRSVVTRIFGSERKRDQIRALFDNPDDFNRLKLLLEREARMAETKHHVLGGSPTARIAAEQMDMVSGAVGPMVQAAQGNVMGALSQIGTSALMNRARGVTEGTAAALGPRLTAQADNPKAVRTLLDALLEAEQRATRQQTRRQATLRGAGVVAGGAQARRRP